MRTWLDQLRRRLQPFRTDSDISDELRAHYDSLVEEGQAKGLTTQEANRRARLQLGGSRSVVERVREVEFSTVIESVYRDLAMGLRSLRRNPVFAITAILTLAAGIGANTLVFTLLHGLLLRSLPVEDPAALVRIGVASPAIDAFSQSDMPYRMLLQLRRQQTSFADIFGWQNRFVVLDSGEGVQSGLMEGDGFATLGLKAHIGRMLIADDDVPGGPAEGWPVVLGYGYWMDAFGGDPAALGKRINLSRTTATIVGVAPKNFRGLWHGSETKFYLPLHFLNVLMARDVLSGPAWAITIARLRPGVSIDSARAELKIHEAELIRQFIPAEMQARAEFKNAFLSAASARTGLPTFFGRVYSRPLFLMQGLVAIVLLLCCVNVAGLMMAKVHARRQEFAVRTAIGAARWRLVRQYLTESFVIALAGAGLGALAAWYGTAYMLPFFRHPNEGIGMSIQPDGTVFQITAFFAVFTTLLFGTLPAWRAGAAGYAPLLRSRSTGAARGRIFGRAFIPLQVGLSFALVSIAAALSQSLLRLQTEETGFDLDHVTIQTAPLHLLNVSAEARMELYHRMKARLEQTPGITASFTWYTPMTSFQAVSSFQAVTAGASPPEDPRMAFNQVGPGYFQTMKTAILSGREFDRHERDHGVCILNQSAAAYLFPGQQAIGQYVRSTDEKVSPQPPPCRVIGLARDAKFANLHEAPPRTIYFPISVRTLERNMVFLINAPTKAQAVAAYRAAKAELSPSTPFVLFVTLREQMDAALGSQRALSLMSGFFAAVALFLSGLGLYGLLSSSVAQRTGEIGVRMALGAERGCVLRMILSEALVLLAAGLVLGGIVFAGAVRFIDGMLYGVSAFDPLRIAAITGVLTVVALAASLIPALRAAWVDPMQALRADG